MADILHKVAVEATTTQVFDALMDGSLLSGWWVEIEMQLVDVEDDRRIAWRCVEGPPEWIDTQITFDLVREGARTIVRFGHKNWREANDFMAHCTTRWAHALFSLKAHIEAPDPEDVLVRP